VYVIRILFRTGAQLDLNFEDLGVAQRALSAMTETRAEKEQIRVLDEAGRDFWFQSVDVLAHGLIDVEAETLSVVKLGLAINAAGERAKRRAGIVEPPPFDEPYVQPKPAPGGALESLIPSTNDKRLPRFSG
jgi:hypothetical protein